MVPEAGPRSLSENRIGSPRIGVTLQLRDHRPGQVQDPVMLSDVEFIPTLSVRWIVVVGCFTYDAVQVEVERTGTGDRMIPDAA
jgi:hypothetical protein